MIKINKLAAQAANLAGKGGKEYLLKKVFEIEGVDCKRVNAPLYDFIQGGSRLEFKKQANVQWFDIGKYHNLKKEDKSIDMVFVVTSKGRVNDLPTGEIEWIVAIKLGTMIHLLLNDEKYRALGWTKENFKTCHEQKRKYPTQQAKVQLEMRSFIIENRAYTKALFVNSKVKKITKKRTK
jgi:hypothetical protein